MSLCPHGYTAFWDCPTCPEPLGTAAIPTTVMCDWCDGTGRVRTVVRVLAVNPDKRSMDITTDYEACQECKGTGEVVAP